MSNLPGRAEAAAKSDILRSKSPQTTLFTDSCLEPKKDLQARA
jgi:hypothetical protein